MPCHSPPQNPAGRAFGSLYLEFEPATDNAFAIGAGNYRTAMIYENRRLHSESPGFQKHSAAKASNSLIFRYWHRALVPFQNH